MILSFPRRFMKYDDQEGIPWTEQLWCRLVCVSVIQIPNDSLLTSGFISEHSLLLVIISLLWSSPYFGYPLFTLVIISLLWLLFPYFDYPVFTLVFLSLLWLSSLWLIMVRVICWLKDDLTLGSWLDLTWHAESSHPNLTEFLHMKWARLR